MENKVLVTDPSDLGPIFDLVFWADEVAIDVETTGLHIIRDELHGFSLATDTDHEHEWYITGEALLPGLGMLANCMQEQPEKVWVGHNIRFDLHFLTRYGVRPAKIADTMVMAWLVDENLSLALKTQAMLRLGYQDLPSFSGLLKDAKETVNMVRRAEADAHNKALPKGEKKSGKVKARVVKLEDVNIHDVFELFPDRLAEYAARDTRLTLELSRVLVYEMVKESEPGLGIDLTKNFWEVEMPLIWVVLDMEKNGLTLNMPHLEELGREFKEASDRLLAEWMELSGGVNPASPKQLGEYLFKVRKFPSQGKTKTGGDSTDDFALSKLEKLDTTGAIKALREYKGYEKLYSTYVSSFLEQNVDGVLYGSFNQTGTVTGRFSSNNPNLQNIPSRGDLGKRVRKLFIAGNGGVLMDPDYSALEMRIFTHFTKEPKLIKVFNEDGDPHQMIADEHGCERKVAKILNFGSIYGMGPGKFADTMEKEGFERPSKEESYEYIDGYWNAIPVAKAWKVKALAYARRLGFVKTIDGRKRRLPGLRSFDKKVRAAAERDAINNLVQGSGGGPMRWVMIQIHEKVCKPYGVKMLAQVHDELLLWAPSKEVGEAVKPLVVDIMSSIREKYGFIVPIKTECPIGDNWADIH
jgi:DNA polymerase-1